MKTFYRRFHKYLPMAVIFLTAFLFLGYLFWPKSQSINNPSSQPLKISNGRINFLLLGRGGGTHDGPDLTDSMMVVSIPASGSGTIYTLSLPRDIYSDQINEKINAAYTIGKDRYNDGISTVSAVVKQITGLDNNYVVLVDFKAFVQAIDLVGGIDVNVENTFTDKMYPIQGKENDNCEGVDPEFMCRYESITFNKGLTHMDGATALKFTRSRHSQDLIEGTDFARAKRQQLVLKAIKDKYLRIENIFSLTKIQSIYKIIQNNIFMTISPSDYNQLINLAFKLKDSPIKNISIPESYLINPPIDQRGWILLPTDNNFDHIHATISSQLQ